jgi:hypothetical protein
MVRLVHDGGNRRGGRSGCSHDGDGENGGSAPFAISRRYPMQLSAAGDGPAGRMDRDGGTGAGGWPGRGRATTARADTPVACISGNPDTPPCNCLPSVTARWLDAPRQRPAAGGWAGLAPGHRGEGRTAPACISRYSDTTPCNCLPSVTARWSAGPRRRHRSGTDGRSGAGQSRRGQDAGSVHYGKFRRYPMQLSAISYGLVVSMDHDDGTGRGRLARWGPGRGR